MKRWALRILAGLSMAAGAVSTYNLLVDPANRVGGALGESPAVFLGPFLITVGILLAWRPARAQYRALLWVGGSLWLLLGLLYAWEVISGSEVVRFLVSVGLVVIGLPAISLVAVGLWARIRRPTTA
jgi:hypothetical protein